MRKMNLMLLCVSVNKFCTIMSHYSLVLCFFTCSNLPESCANDLKGPIFCLVNPTWRMTVCISTISTTNAVLIWHDRRSSASCKSTHFFQTVAWFQAYLATFFLHKSIAKFPFQSFLSVLIHMPTGSMLAIDTLHSIRNTLISWSFYR